jgi:hypothetical protein
MFPVMKGTRKSQVLEKTNISCLYRSADSSMFYGIFTRKGDQVKKSLKPTDNIGIPRLSVVARVPRDTLKGHGNSRGSRQLLQSSALVWPWVGRAIPGV